MTPMTADELKDQFAALSPLPEVEPEHSWRYWAQSLRQSVADLDPEKFLTWPTVVSTMFVGNAPYIDTEIDDLPAEYRAEAVLRETRFGSPEIYRYGAIATSGNLIHQAYHLSQANKWLPGLDTIIEIGGGYGAAALLCYRLGFRGRYIIYDVPEFSLLQQYYLSNVGVDNVEFMTAIDAPIESDLLIGLYSLTEIPLVSRDLLLDLCPTSSYLLAFMSTWGGFDNMRWASTVVKRKGYTWRVWNVKHLPACWYLRGDEIR